MESKELVTEVRQKGRTRQRCKKVAGYGRRRVGGRHSEVSVGGGKQVRVPVSTLHSTQTVKVQAGQL